MLYEKGLVPPELIDTTRPSPERRAKGPYAVI